MPRRPILTVFVVSVIAVASERPMRAQDQATTQAAAQATAQTVTLWSFLGIPQAISTINGHVINRRGNVPGLEKKPPLKALADPLNLESPWEAVKVAAEVKQAEDAAPQKIKAVKYLAGIGCGCYDTKMDGAVTNALVAAMDDCTESVRMATIEAITEVACDEACVKCGQRSCCNEAILAQLAKLAYERDETGCYVEPSADVRQAAIAALESCCPGTGDIIIEEEPLEREREEGQEPAIPTPVPAVPEVTGPASEESSRRTATHVAAPREWQAPLGPAPVVERVEGRVDAIDKAGGRVRIAVDSHVTLLVGSEIEAYHDYLLGRSLVAKLRVSSASPGVAVAHPVSPDAVRQRIARGDTIIGMGSAVPVRTDSAVAVVSEPMPMPRPGPHPPAAVNDRRATRPESVLADSGDRRQVMAAPTQLPVRTSGAPASRTSPAVGAVSDRLPALPAPTQLPVRNSSASASRTSSTLSAVSDRRPALPAPIQPPVHRSATPSSQTSSAVGAVSDRPRPADAKPVRPEADARRPSVQAAFVNAVLK